MTPQSTSTQRIEPTQHRRLENDAYATSVSVVIPAHNASEYICDQLRALDQQTYSEYFSVIVVDDGSSDNTLKLVRKWASAHPYVHVIASPRQRGAATARSIGCQESTSDYLLFCDADDIVDRNWVSKMVNGLALAHAVGGKLERRTLNSKAARSARPPETLTGLRQASDYGFIPYAPGGNFAIRRNVWNELGGFDRDFRKGVEDVEFSWRLQLAGYVIDYEPQAIVHYRYRSTPSELARQYFTYGYAHAQLYARFAKHGMPRSSTRNAFRQITWLLMHIADSWGTEIEKSVYVKKLAIQLGRITGSLRHATWYL